MEMLTRRAWLATAAATVLSGGCARLSLAALPTVVGTKVALSIYIMDGTPLRKLTRMQKFLLDTAHHLAPHARVTIAAGDGTLPLAWFPPPPVTVLLDPSSLYRDDPSISMPDIVLCSHSILPNKLAVRALDLAPYVKTDQGDFEGISGTVIREGLANCPQRGTVQAGLPLLRIPMVAFVGDGIDPLPGGRPWTTVEFEATLARLMPTMKPGMPLISVELRRLFGPAAVGSGGTLARTLERGCTATFGQAPALASVADVAGWIRYAYMPIANFPTRKYGVLIDYLSTFFTSGPELGISWRWRVGPCPAFTQTLAVATDNIDLMVFRHTAHPQAATSLAAALLSAPVQEAMTDAPGLPVRAGAATDYLKRTRNAQRVVGASYLADPSHDVTWQDAYGGTESPANVTAVGAVQQALRDALEPLLGAYAYRDAPTPEGVPAHAEIMSALQQAQSQVNG